MIIFFKGLFFNTGRLQLFVALFTTVLVLDCANAGVVKIKTLDRFPAVRTTWEITENPFQLSLDKNLSLPVGNPEFHLLNGKTLAKMKPQSEKVSLDKGVIKVFAKYKGGLEVTHEIGNKGGILSWKMTFNNKSNQELWFEPSLRFPVKNIRHGNYWDGLTFHDLSQKPFKRDLLNHTFPIACLMNGEIGFALGTSPVIDSSYLKNGVDKKNNFYYSTRIVLPTGEKTSFEFIAFAFIPNYQHLDAVSIYYQTFDFAFKPAPGVDPRLTSGRYTDAMQNAQHMGITSPQKSMQAVENYCGVEWGYTLYRRQGDFYGRKEHWDDYKLSKGEMTKLQSESDRSMNKIDIDKSHQDLAFLFSSADYRANIMLAFYIFNQVEKGLVKKCGMEEYIYPSEVGVPAYRRAWGLSHGLSGHIYPWATPFETILRKDLTDLVRDFDIRAFCQDGFTDLDSVTPIGRSEVYRGKLDYYLPGWSYDSEGKYIRKGVGLRHNADFIHTLTKGDLRIGHFANMWWGNPLFSFTPDAYLSECYSYKNVNGINYQSIKQGQLFRGIKPSYLHDWGQVQLGDVLPWETMSPEDIRLAYEDYVRDMTVALYQTGMIPSWYLVATHKPLYRELPTFIDVVSRGFSPVPAIRGKGKVERVRYGQALNSCMVLSNRKRTPQTLIETIDNDYLGDFSAIPVLFKGDKKLKSTVNGSQTILNTVIGPQENLIIAVPVAIKLAKKSKLEVESSVNNSYYEKKYICSINTATAVSGSLSITPDRNYELESVTLNGEKLTDCRNINLKAGTNDLFVTTRSNVFLNQESVYAKFDFANAEIIIDSDAADREKGTAKMMQDYFQVKLKSILKITNIPTRKSGNIILSKKLKNTGIYVDTDNNLCMVESEAFELQQNVWAFLHLLDRTDPRFKMKRWYPILGLTDINKGMIKKMGMEKQTYDESKSVRRVVWSSLTRSNKNKKIVADNVVQNTDPVPILSVPILNENPTLDGKLDDPAWGRAAKVKTFSIINTNPPKTPTQKTEVRVFVTDQDIYVGFQCFEENMNRIMAFCTKRDSMIWLDDDFELRLAPGIGADIADYPYYTFLINSKGTKLDILQLPNQMPDSEASNFVGPNWGKSGSGTDWNAKWEVKTFIDKNYWSGEIRIPLSEINALNKDIWRLHFARNEQPNVEFSCWPKIIGRSINQPSFFAVMKIKK
jgi:hypothetical protein